MNVTSLFAQVSEATCTVNGQEVDCAEATEAAAGFLGLGLGIFAVIALICLVAFVFWVMMLIHALKHDSPNKGMWLAILIISFLVGFGFFGAIAYYFAEKKKIDNSVQPGPQQQVGPPPVAPEVATPLSDQSQATVNTEQTVAPIDQPTAPEAPQTDTTAAATQPTESAPDVPQQPSQEPVVRPQEPGVVQPDQNATPSPDGDQDQQPDQNQNNPQQ